MPNKNFVFCVLLFGIQFLLTSSITAIPYKLGWSRGDIKIQKHYEIKEVQGFLEYDSSVELLEESITASKILATSIASIIKWKNTSGENYGEVWLLGFLVGLILTFLVLSSLSKIRPYILCGFWFVGLIFLYIWRSGFLFQTFPFLQESPNGEIYFFVLQSIPLISYLVITKTVTVLQIKDFQIFQQVFTIFLRISISYLVVVVVASFLSIDLVVNNFEIIQGIFWVFLGLLGIPSLAWLVLSSRQNLNFYKFQASFALLFLAAVVGRIIFNPVDFSSAFFKPMHLLIGTVVQLVYMFWLLLTGMAENLKIQAEESDNALEVSIGQLEAEEFIKPSLGSLTSRELDILTAYCNGFSYKEISSSFLISPNTVKSHLKSCYRKLEINSKVEAISIMNNNNNK